MKIARRFAPETYIAIVRNAARIEPTAYPVSRSRVIPPARPAPPMWNTSNAAAMAPTKASALTMPSWNAARLTGRRMPMAAPSAAPDDVPRTYGSARGLRTMPWNVAPAIARPAPTTAAVSTRGSRSSQTIVSVAGVQVLPRSSPVMR